MQSANATVKFKARVCGRQRLLCGVVQGAALAGISRGGVAETFAVRQPIAAYARADSGAAARILAAPAERGDPGAQSYLGFIYETGRGVPRNYTQAVRSCTCRDARLLSPSHQLYDFCAGK